MILSNHCVGRFHERFRPALDLIRARAELEQLIKHGEIASAAPDWMAKTMRQETDAYLIVGDDLVMPLVSVGPLGEMLAKTCIPRGGISAPARARRNERGRRRRAAKRHSARR